VTETRDGRGGDFGLIDERSLRPSPDLRCPADPVTQDFEVAQKDATVCTNAKIIWERRFIRVRQ